MEIAEVSTDVIARTLSSLSSYLDSWRIFAKYLGRDDKKLMRKYFKESGNRCYFTLTRGMLEEWADEERGKATIKTLINVANLLEKKHVVEILGKFPNSNAVVVASSHESEVCELPSDIEDAIKKIQKEEQKENDARGNLKLMHVLRNADPKHGRIEIFLSRLIQILSKVGNKPVVIVSINGMMRSGKSFMANNFIKYLKYHQKGQTWIDKELPGEFKWASGLTTVTSGIETWYEPIIVEHDGQELAVVVLDTQGLHDLQTNAKENKIIFGLSALLSSVFIYNEKSVNSLILQDLHSSLEFAKFTGTTGAQIKFQKLILLLRDWDPDHSQYPYGYYDQNFSTGNQNLMEHYFGTGVALSADVNATRTGILNCFEDVFIYAMANPEKKKPDLPQYSESSSWDNDFRKTVIDFIQKTLAPEVLVGFVKTVYGEKMTGESLKEFVNMWVELIQDAEGDLEFKTILDTNAEILYSRKVNKILEEFLQIINKMLQGSPNGVNYHVFEEFVKNTKVEQEKKFNDVNLFGSPEIQANFKAELHAKLRSLIEDFQEKNVTNAKILYSKTIAGLLEEFQTILNKMTQDNPSGIDYQVFDELSLEQKSKQEQTFHQMEVFGSPALKSEFRTELMERLNDFIQDSKAINNINLDAAAEQKRLEQLIKDEQEAHRKKMLAEKQKRIADAQRYSQQLYTDLQVAKGKRDQVIQNKQKYTKQETSSKAIRLFGLFKIGKSTSVKMVYDDAAYQAALKAANEEVAEKQRRYDQAVAQCNSIVSEKID